MVSAVGPESVDPTGPDTSPLPGIVRIGYGLGSFGTGIFGAVPGLLLLYYLTDVLGVAPLLAGVVVFLPKAWDAVANPYAGTLSDRTEHRWGPRRPWMLGGALTLPFLFAAMFAGPPLDGEWAALYVGVMYLLAATAFAAFQVPYIAMPSEITTDHHERTRMMSWRVAFLSVAIMLSGGLAPIIAGHSGNDDPGTMNGYRVMGLVLGAMLMAGMLAAFFTTARATTVVRATAGEKSILKQLAIARTNRSFMNLLGMYVVQAIGAGAMLAGVQYFATYVLDDSSATTWLFAALVLPSIVAMPGWSRAALRYGKRNAAFAASCCFLVAALLMTSAEHVPAGAVYVFTGIAGIGYAGMQMLPMSMIGDAVAVDAMITGERRAGVFTGVWTAAEMLGLALGAGVFAAVLQVTGFVASDADHRVPQPDSALTGVLLGFTLLPAVLLVVSMPFILRYDLTEAKLAALLDRHKAAPAGNAAEPDPEEADMPSPFDLENLEKESR
ncbi:MFS transporter [Yinghuangia seranimata]|uniref:MFS transporter n=1 Tax=Yinghuangia seranimata TaxID=408067 RepID=UPI00248D3052|nr:MFS transporter [Yinghuangia seranimata]MDI2132075.1 MFS transporter [Yinghuangia seranimata]